MFLKWAGVARFGDAKSCVSTDVFNSVGDLMPLALLDKTGAENQAEKSCGYSRGAAHSVTLDFAAFL